MDPLVSTDWLAARPGALVLDASWHMDGRDAGAEFLRGHVPGAQRFDLEALSASGPLPHMAPGAGAFEAWARSVGVSEGTVVVAYDTVGLFSAARAWWTFRLMGHRAVAVLDGGLPKWAREGRTLEAGPAWARPPGSFVARPDPSLLATADDVARAPLVLDARSAARFRGEAPEPRPGLRSGHVPGSLSVPFTDLLNADGTMRDPPVLPGEGPAVTTCGSGVTAAILSLALERLGRPHALYDGSWAEWGADPLRPVTTGP